MSTPPRPDAEPQRYLLAFVTDQWEWEADLLADTLEEARAASEAALVALVHDERPELACVTLLQGGVKIGVWDWLAARAHWTPL